MTYGDFKEREKRESRREYSREHYKRYYARIKADPKGYAAFLEKRRLNAQKQYEALKADPERYAKFLERAHKNKLLRQQKEPRPRRPNNPRKIEAMSAEERRVYYKQRITRILAREHAAQKGLDLYTVYESWGVVFTRDYPGMRNPAATKAEQTKRERTLETAK